MGNCWGTSNTNGDSHGQEGSGGNLSSHRRANGVSLRPYTYSDMKTATRNFRTENKLGEGGFGSVFRGYLDRETLVPVKRRNGMMVAIKKLNLDGRQGHEEWVTEVQFLGALRHPNIVRLIGFCAEDRNRLLVYEYMSRGSLDNHLFREGTHNQGLSWNNRMRVALGAATGLAFLHDAEQHIIYRDFKAANILLDEQYNAKLSDFGLAKDGPTGEDTHVSTRVMGTYGYAAPEYLATGHLSIKSDVYSFGVALLELLTGRHALDERRPIGEHKVAEWAKPYLGSKDRVRYLMDPRLNGDYPFREAHRVATIASLCVNDDARERPTMKEVVVSLKQCIGAMSP